MFEQLNIYNRIQNFFECRGENKIKIYPFHNSLFTGRGRTLFRTEKTSIQRSSPPLD
jgi:hypothetical protein